MALIFNLWEVSGVSPQLKLYLYQPNKCQRTPAITGLNNERGVDLNPFKPANYVIVVLLERQHLAIV